MHLFVVQGEAEQFLMLMVRLLLLLRFETLMI